MRRGDALQPMGAMPCAVLRIPGGEATLRDREEIMATICPKDAYWRDSAEWFDFCGDRCSLVDPHACQAMRG